MIDFAIAHWDWLAAAVVGHFGFSAIGSAVTWVKGEYTAVKTDIAAVKTAVAAPAAAAAPTAPAAK